ncbi:MAG: sulfatase-like hydrolase/transferase [Acidobacteriota bacterium]|nr:sulfatase-like hydrolase/transferase [Acidobacteriota bacterium]MDE3266069.1 sulfatase-like hydrolase/transferase [Acidobacteriota bacterium]
MRRLLVAASAVLVWSACASPPTPEDAGGEVAARPPIVLISIDTLRSDRLPAYGYEGVETPAIDRLAGDGVLFERAYSHVNVTLPSHASIFTGLLPSEHGVRDNAGYRLDEAIPTLAAELNRHGYSTGGFVSSYVLRSGTGIARGFEIYDDGVGFETGRQLGQNQRAGADTLAAASEWLDGVAREPFFLFLHLYEPHAPYAPPPPFAGRYGNPYDGEVAAADSVVGELIGRLEELGVYEDALVVLLSDHGEGLMDHGEMDHLILIYREVLQVPLIVKLPRGERAGERVAANAQLSDVAPAIYSVLGLEPPEGLAGADLLGLDEMAAGAPLRQIVSESVYPRIHFGWSDLASIVEGDLHFIESPDPELFRLSEDPQERNNVIQEERAAARRFRAALAETDRTLTSPVEDDPEIRQRLESLGYLSGGASGAAGPLADPKSRIGVVADLGRAARLIGSGDLTEAEAALQDVLRQEPQLVLAWQQLGDVLERRERPRQALEAYRRAFELSAGDAASAGLKVAELLLLEGRVAEAREHALAVVERAPMANDVLAQAALFENDLAAAEEYLQLAIAARGPQVAPLITKLAWLNRQDRFEETATLSDEVLAEFGERGDRGILGHLYLYRGTALAALGREPEAESAYREAIALRPELLGAYSSLAFLQALTGRGAEVGRTLQEMVTVNPNPGAYAEAVRALRAMNDPRSADGVLGEALRQWPEAEELRLLAASR